MGTMHLAIFAVTVASAATVQEGSSAPSVRSTLMLVTWRSRHAITHSTESAFNTGMKCALNSRDPHCPTCRCPRLVLLLARGRSSSDTTSVSQQRRRDAERLFRELEARRMAIDGVRGNVFENSAQPRCGEYYSFGSTRRPSDTPGASHGEFEGWGQNHRPEHKTWWSRWLSA